MENRLQWYATEDDNAEHLALHGKGFDSGKAYFKYLYFFIYN